MSRMCREKGAVRHDDRLDCLSQGVQYFTDALSISAYEQIKLAKQDDWNDMEEAWQNDPQSAANSMVFGMNVDQRRQSRLIHGNNSVHKWV